MESHGPIIHLISLCLSTEEGLMPRNERPTSPQASVSGRVPTQLKNKSNDVDELVELRRLYENPFAEGALACRQKNS